VWLAQESLTALGADIFMKANAAAGALTGSSDALSKSTRRKMDEAKRLLSLTVSRRDLI
jgi:hypothetical protein